ncbi:efflux RND transporter periplasmic adaptor subunit [Helicobacter ibis]|uniref:Efflux RND transporter periplasmic adaptor subunit n=1 Tax=Helicobacter ibis TaxID=2962633 RepID=A0ABT4VFB9_9HELI|nr:biotin/lipoyl-binding protein [Helicobacter ibis]MDA3969394.1 efflux RND transporter periplasmic adaptor subunit [Helicobacter ibis]
MRYVVVFVMFFGVALCEGIYATFHIQPIKKATLSLSSSGIIKEIFVDVGSHVKKGDKLLALKNDDLKASVEVSLALLEGARIQHSFLKDQFLRYEKSKEAIDKNTFEKIATQYKTSLYELKKAESNYKLQKELLEKSILYAPFSGVISEKFVEVGDGIGAISSKLFILESKEKKALIEFDSKYFTQVKVGNKLENNISKNPITINKIYPSINDKTKKAIAEGEFLESIPSGIFGDGFIQP